MTAVVQYDVQWFSKKRENGVTERDSCLVWFFGCHTVTISDKICPAELVAVTLFRYRFALEVTMKSITEAGRGAVYQMCRLVRLCCALMYFLTIVLPLCALSDVFRWLADRAYHIGEAFMSGDESET